MRNVREQSYQLAEQPFSPRLLKWVQMQGGARIPHSAFRNPHSAMESWAFFSSLLGPGAGRDYAAAPVKSIGNPVLARLSVTATPAAARSRELPGPCNFLSFRVSK